MVEVKGGNGEKWNAHAFKFSLARKTIKTKLFEHHPTDQKKWIQKKWKIVQIRIFILVAYFQLQKCVGR
jgi:hypothetical protein